MFTGIIEQLGTVKFLEKKSTIYQLEVAVFGLAEDTRAGQSICVNGVCLTAVRSEKGLVVFEIMPETIKRSNLGRLKLGDKVNLERAVKVNGRLDGHLVSGHIDETALVSKRQEQAGEAVLSVKVSTSLLPYIVIKGSLAVDGVSLTVSAIQGQEISVNLIPYTLKNSTLGIRKIGDLVNIEADILAKYVHNYLSHNEKYQSSLSQSFLKEHGF
ncbi:MAG: riboflavin synthase [Candidatus Omnitrophica bacterium]|nr:riboflavin synthase [Candidatus Omnitrophota bacterium]